jgi:hypothetical protein
MSREKMLKSEALLTLALQTHFSLKATSAPTLHRENDKGPVQFFRVGALLAPSLLEKSAVWHLSRPNPSLQRTLRAVELERC